MSATEHPRAPDQQVDSDAMYRMLRENKTDLEIRTSLAGYSPQALLVFLENIYETTKRVSVSAHNARMGEGLGQFAFLDKIQNLFTIILAILTEKFAALERMTPVSGTIPAIRDVELDAYANTIRMRSEWECEDGPLHK